MTGEDADGPDLAFTLVLRRSLEDGERRELDRLLRAWYDVGAYGGYSRLGTRDEGRRRSFHNAWDTPIVVEMGGELSVRWAVDTGSAPRESVEVLADALDGMSAFLALPPGLRAPFERLEVRTAEDGWTGDGEILHEPWFD